MAEDYCPIIRYKWAFTEAKDNEVIIPESNKKLRVVYFQLSSYTDDLLISLHEEGNEYNALFYGKTKAGTIVNGNLIGCNYKTEKVDKKLFCNLSIVGEVYLVLFFAEV